ncbi:hypothetical protein AFLA70_405g001050 [Aspergillus flavus AF70]|nr:hypothetical protein AFLA70_405g001050 [Aspergillus flavus AF70]
MYIAYNGSSLRLWLDKIYSETNIIPIYMPAYSSHFLQPLDVSCFSLVVRGAIMLMRKNGGMLVTAVFPLFNGVDDSEKSLIGNTVVQFSSVGFS